MKNLTRFFFRRCKKCFDLLNKSAKKVLKVYANFLLVFVKNMQKLSFIFSYAFAENVKKIEKFFIKLGFKNFNIDEFGFFTLC